jgi:hypothetical protein
VHDAVVSERRTEMSSNKTDRVVRRPFLWTAGVFLVIVLILFTKILFDVEEQPGEPIPPRPHPASDRSLRTASRNPNERVLVPCPRYEIPEYALKIRVFHKERKLYERTFGFAEPQPDWENIDDLADRGGVLTGWSRKEGTNFHVSISQTPGKKGIHLDVTAHFSDKSGRSEMKRTISPEYKVSQSITCEQGFTIQYEWLE